MNDFKNECSVNGNCSFEFQDILVCLLMHANDISVMSESIDSLENMLKHFVTLYRGTGLRVAC